MLTAEMREKWKTRLEGERDGTHWPGCEMERHRGCAILVLIADVEKAESALAATREQLENAENDVRLALADQATIVERCRESGRGDLQRTG